MQSLSEKLPIEVWQQISECIKDLDFNDNNKEEYYENLQALKIRLASLNLIEGSRTPKTNEEVGIATILQSIYNTGFDNGHFKKMTFCRNIYTLTSLGVEEIEFRPIDFYDSIIGLKQIYYKTDDKTVYEKAYTDGIFELRTTLRERKNDLGYIYDIVNLRDANFILKVLLHKKNNPKEIEPIKMKHISISLKNFKGRYPSRNTIMLDCFPNLIIPKQTVGFGEEIHDLQEDFESIPIHDSDWVKRLVKDKNSEYYKK